jgi:hypothetical protein
MRPRIRALKTARKQTEIKSSRDNFHPSRPHWHIRSSLVGRSLENSVAKGKKNISGETIQPLQATASGRTRLWER